MRKFEYKKQFDLSEDELNRLGKNGWELVSVYKLHPENMHTIFILKKEL